MDYVKEKRRLRRQKFKIFLRKLFRKSPNTIVIDSYAGDFMDDVSAYEHAMLDLLRVTGTENMDIKFELCFRPRLTPEALELFGDLDRVRFQNAVSDRLLSVKRLRVFFEDDDQLVRFRLVASDKLDFKIL